MTTNFGYQYDTNSNDAAYGLAVTPGATKGLSQILTSGTNSFTFSYTTGASPLTNGDLGLFFSTSPTSYNPTSSAITPDLLVSATAGGLTFFTPATGTTINNYHYSSGPTSANGLTSVGIGGYTISVSSYSVTSTPTGSFTLTVTQTPEPGIVGLMAGISVSGGIFALGRRRRRPAVKK